MYHLKFERTIIINHIIKDTPYKSVEKIKI